jgi:hypothetical protein
VCTLAVLAAILSLEKDASGKTAAGAYRIV